MGKLHELLAVESSLEGVYRKILKETSENFKKHPERYFGAHQRIEFFDEAAPKEDDNHKAMDDTVPDKLQYTADHIIRYLDAVLQKEATNQSARADIVIDGEVIANDVPATFLLGLEKKLKEIRAVYEAAPTLKPGIAWVPDPGYEKDHVYKREHDDKRFRTKKLRNNHVIAPATDKHPAQVEVYTEDVNIATVTTTEWSGTISPAEKSEYLARIDKLDRAVKVARQKANRQDVANVTIGDLLFKYINK